MLAAPAQASTGAFQRAWGKDVVAGGPTGFEVCTSASACKTGEEGAFGGELGESQGVAVDAAGNLYSIDRTHLRVDKYGPSGTWQRSWGKDVVGGGTTGFEVCTAAAACKEGELGEAGGEFNSPGGIAVGSGGLVYVADSGNNRVQVFDSSGGFERTWGNGVDGGSGFAVCSQAESCVAGAPGGLGGEMSGPVGIATDAAGNVYVGDVYRIQKFASTGDWQLAWGKDVVAGAPTDFEVCYDATECQSGLSGGLGGELNFPNGLATDSSDRVYVAEPLNHRIQRYDSAGGWQRAWGKDVVAGGSAGFEVCTAAASCKSGISGGLGGELDFPKSVTVDGSGKVYVADTSNDRVQRFDAAGGFERAWGADVVAGGSAGFEICTAAPLCQAGGSDAGLGGHLNNPSGVGATAAGILFVADSDNHRVQRFGDPPPPPPPSHPTRGPASNEFQIGKLKRKLLTVTVPGPGVVAVLDVADQAAAGRAIALAAKKRLKPSSATATAAGDVKVKLKLTKAAKRKLKRKGKAKVNAAVTFTPDGGTAGTQTKKLKVKK